MTRYRWDGERFVDRDGIPMAVPQRDFVPSPYVMADCEYMSPLSLKPVTSRSQRREEMKVHNVREVDPSEYKPTYHNKKRAEADRHLKIEHEPRPKVDLGEGYQRLSPHQLPASIRKTVSND